MFSANHWNQGADASGFQGAQCMVLWPKLVIKVFLQGLMPRRGISQAEPPTGPQNEPYIRDSAFLWCVASVWRCLSCVLASFVVWCAVSVKFSPCWSFVLCAVVAFSWRPLSVFVSPGIWSYENFQWIMRFSPHFRPAFASRTSVSAQLDLKVVVNAGSRSTLYPHTHTPLQLVPSASQAPSAFANKSSHSFSAIVVLMVLVYTAECHMVNFRTSTAADELLQPPGQCWRPLRSIPTLSGVRLLNFLRLYAS